MPSTRSLGCSRGGNLWFVTVRWCPHAWPVGWQQPSGPCGWQFPVSGSEPSKMQRGAQKVRGKGAWVEFRPSRSLWYVKAVCIHLYIKRKEDLSLLLWWWFSMRSVL